MRRAIEASFFKLLEDRPFEKITVKDIVDDCGVTRNTFYNYYEDTYDVVDGLLRREMIELVRGEGTQTTVAEAMHCVAQIALEHPRSCNHLFRSPKREELLYYFNKAVSVTVGHVVDRTIGEEPIDARDKQLIVDAYCHAAAGFFSDWVMRGMPDDPESALSRLDVLFADSMERAIARARECPIGAVAAEDGVSATVADDGVGSDASGGAQADAGEPAGQTKGEK